MDRKNYTHTLYASYIGYIVQAIVISFTPLLFLTFQKTYSISMDRITFLVTINFAVQLMVDGLAAHFVGRVGYRISAITAHICAATGLIGLSFLPDQMRDSYLGILICMCLYAVGGGMIEVLVSPIVEACPTEKKEGSMSLLHSFYCWGVVFVIIVSTLFFQLVGVEHWRMLSCIWAILPIFNMVYFIFVPLPSKEEGEKVLSVRTIFSDKTFWLFALIMFCAGAAEQGMGQWASVFAESGLGISKTAGDLAGPCAFSFLMGVSRIIYGKFSEKINLQRFMIASGILCIASYLLAALSQNPVLNLMGCSMSGLAIGIMWPGGYSMAAKKMKAGKTTTFALLALAGDIGCTSGPALIGFISEMSKKGLKGGILFGTFFPLLLVIGLIINRIIQKKHFNKKEILSAAGIKK